jgi:hypothetical protein
LQLFNGVLIAVDAEVLRVIGNGHLEKFDIVVNQYQTPRTAQTPALVSI